MLSADGSNEVRLHFSGSGDSNEFRYLVTRPTRPVSQPSYFGEWSSSGLVPWCLLRETWIKYETISQTEHHQHQNQRHRACPAVHPLRY